MIESRRPSCFAKKQERRRESEYGVLFGCPSVRPSVRLLPCIGDKLLRPPLIFRTKSKGNFIELPDELSD